MSNQMTDEQKIERWRYDWLLERKDKYSEQSHELTREVDKLCSRLGEIEALCNEIIATLNLEGNRRIFSELPPEWHEIVDNWTDRLARAKNDAA